MTNETYNVYDGVKYMEIRNKVPILKHQYNIIGCTANSLWPYNTSIKRSKRKIIESYYIVYNGTYLISSKIYDNIIWFFEKHILLQLYNQLLWHHYTHISSFQRDKILKIIYLFYFLSILVRYIHDHYCRINIHRWLYTYRYFYIYNILVM